MSRHTFDHHDDTWTVGYDRPLATFYAQVEPRPDLAHDPAAHAAFTRRHPATGRHDPDDPLTTVAGERARELPTLDDLTATLTARGVELPAAIRAQLQRDQPLPRAAPLPLTAVTRADAQHAAQRATHARSATPRPTAVPPPRRQR